jgi:phosphoserine phosphatase RsbU/P
MRFRSRPLAFYLHSAILTAAIVALTIVVFSAYLTTRSILRSNIQKEAELLTESILQRVTVVEQAVVTIAANMATALEEMAVTNDEHDSYLKKIVSENPELYGVAIAVAPKSYEPSDECYARYCFRKDESLIQYADLTDSSIDIRIEDWFQIAALTQKPIWLEPYYGQAGGALMTSYCQPFRVPGRWDLYGVIVIDVSLESLSRLVSGIQILEHGYGFLVTSTGTIFVHPVKDFIMNQTLFTLAAERNDAMVEELGHRMLQGERGHLFVEKDIHRPESQVSYAPFQHAPWSLGLVLPLSELNSDLNKLNQDIVLLGLAGLGILFLIIRRLSQKMTRPLVQLTATAELLGRGDLQSVIPKLKTGDEFETLSQAFQNMQAELRDYIHQLTESTAAKERLENELRIARDIQMSIIPKSFPAFPDREDMDIYADIRPAKAVGGDLYDFFFIDDDLLAFTLGDVSGKGVPASLFMAVTRTLFHASCQSDQPVNILIEKMNEALCADNDASMFVTLFAGILNLKTGELSYCNAGHNPPVLMRKGAEPVWVDDKHGLPLGVMDGFGYDLSTMILQKGDQLFLYSDGVTEAENIDKDLFEEGRLIETLSNLKEKNDPETQINQVFEAVARFVGEAEQSDDITMLSLEYFGQENLNTEAVVAKEKEFAFRNELEELNSLSEKLEELGDEWELPMPVVMNLNLALEELITNTIFYGIQDDQPHTISVKFSLTENALNIEIRDDGIEFNPLQLPDPDLEIAAEERQIGGLGIYLVKQVMDRFEYSREEPYNIVTLTKKL